MTGEAVEITSKVNGFLTVRPRYQAKMRNRGDDHIYDGASWAKNAYYRLGTAVAI